MPSMRSLVRSGSQALARHLEQLREALDTLGERLRDALARAVSQSVAAAVREAVLAVLAEGPPRPLPDERPRDPPSALWDAPAEPTWLEATADWAEAAADDPPARSRRPGRRRAPHDRDDEPAAPCPQELAPQRPHGLINILGPALLAGCETAARWLRRRPGRGAVLTALGAGLLVAVLTGVGGPVAATGLGVAGAALGLLGLADTARAGGAALAWLNPP